MRAGKGVCFSPAARASVPRSDASITAFARISWTPPLPATNTPATRPAASRARPQGMVQVWNGIFAFSRASSQTRFTWSGVTSPNAWAGFPRTA